jgi:hypothetical protein
VLCLSGPASEEHFCGKTNDSSDAVDYQMCREYLFMSGFNVFTVGGELARLRAAADRLVRTPAVRKRIEMIAVTPLKHGTLSGADIHGLASSHPPKGFPQLPR